MQIENLKALYKTHKEKQLFGRYVHIKNIEFLLKKMESFYTVETIGKSVNGQNIYSFTIGNGKKKILIWSQMHGNESTTTKALFDIFNSLQDTNAYLSPILNNCTLKVIPILNPDGALAYTRFNANGIDLNRDAQDLSQPESIILRQCFNTFKPDFCFNLHGQRTIFSAGKTSNSATISFLSPSQDIDCTITNNRAVAMEVIMKMNETLQKQIPNQVGVYDDAFNINCVGDMFQNEEVPTILFEAGHYKNDYEREQTREYIFQSLLTALMYIATHKIEGNNYKTYLEIPKNEKRFFDVLIRNAQIIYEDKEQYLDIGILYEERLIGDSIEFIPIIDKITDLSKYHGHKEINANKNEVLSSDRCELKVGYENDFVLINNVKYSLNIENY